MKARRSTRTRTTTLHNLIDLEGEVEVETVKHVITLLNKGHGKRNLKALRKLSLAQALIAGIILILQIIAYVITSGCCHLYGYNLLRLFRELQWCPLSSFLGTAWMTWIIATKPRSRSLRLIGTARACQVASVMVGTGFVLSGISAFGNIGVDWDENCPSIEPLCLNYRMAEIIFCSMVIILNIMAMVVAVLTNQRLRGDNALLIYLSKRRKNSGLRLRRFSPC